MTTTSAPQPAIPTSGSATISPVDRGDRLRPLQLILGILLFVLAEVVMGTVGVLVTVARGGVLDGSMDPLGFLVGAVIGACLAIGGFLLIVGPIGTRPGLALRGRGKAAELAVGLGIGTLLIALSSGLIALLGGYRVTGIEMHPQLLVPLAIGIGAGFIEEMLFRGILLRILDAWCGSWIALALTSLVFGLIHLTNPGASILAACGLVIEAGVLLGAAYLLTRRLWLAIGIHISWNLVQSAVFSSSVSGTGAQRGILEAHLTGPEWLSGGEMGIEGSLVTVLVGLIAGIVLLVLAVRRGRILPSVRTERTRVDQERAGRRRDQAPPQVTGAS